jgi:F-type H+-transporting ATPase subunit b
VELNWTTIVLEIVNFLVLVWLLKHFLYQPVLRVIEARREAIEKTLSTAEEREQAAEKLRSEFENRLDEWQRDKEAAREKLQQELRQRRSRAMEELQKTLSAERERVAVVAEQESREQEERHERAALDLAGKFASRLLERVSGPELEAGLVELFCTELPRIDEDQKAAMRRSAADEQVTVEVESAYELSDERRRQLAQASREFLGHEVNMSFARCPELIAGIRVSIGDWELGANLRDELRYFAEQAHGLG